MPKKVHTKALVILETMWGDPQPEAPGLFRINPENHSGRRLNWLLGTNEFWVTNACKELVGSPKHHGTPDPQRLATNLQRVTYDLLLVCGKVAQKTFEQCNYRPNCKIIFMKHPAARDWTSGDLEAMKYKLQGVKA